MIEALTDEIIKYNLESYICEVIQEKGEIIVVRLSNLDSSYVLKYFENIEYRRELRYYEFFNLNGVKHIDYIAKTDKSILLEDINYSNRYRLGNKDDFSNKKVIKALAHWYKSLHKAGEIYVKSHNNLYSEWDYFNKKNIVLLGDKFDLKNSDGYKLLIRFYDELKKFIDEAPKTLIYHDFYYTNMIVSYDETEAFMFDYNLVGAGSFITDIRNVTYWLGDENKNLFISEYGGFDKKLNLLEEIISPVVTLVIAMNRNIFPNWARESKEQIENQIFSKIDILFR